MSEENKLVSVYVPIKLYNKMQDAKKDKGFKADSGFLVYLLRKYLEAEGYL